MSVDSSALLGRSPPGVVGRPLTELFRADDADTVRVLLYRASFGGHTSTAGVGLAHGGHDDGRMVTLSVSPLVGEQQVMLAFAVASLQQGGSHGEPEADHRRYERHLRRIATEIRAAGLLGEDAASVTGEDRLLRLAEERDFSNRQIEIVQRLLHGQRVSTIAKGLYLSESTVRNHLCSVYRKLGVHCQAELLAIFSAGSKVWSR